MRAWATQVGRERAQANRRDLNRYVLSSGVVVAPPNPPSTLNALEAALDQSQEVKAKVEACADDLASANDLVKARMAEGCVVDDETGALYIAEEDVGLWRYAAEPDGLDVTSAALGAAFPQGLLVVQDGRNITPVERQNFKLFPWERVAAVLGLSQP